MHTEEEFQSFLQINGLIYCFTQLSPAPCFLPPKVELAKLLLL